MAALAAAATLAACGGGGSGNGGEAVLPQAAPVRSPSPPQAIATSPTTTIAGNRGDFSLARASGGIIATERTGAVAPLTVSDAQAIRFNDITINPAIGDLSKTVAQAELQRLMELYVAFFNRVPDADGLAYWIGEYRNGMAIDQMAESFYQAALLYPSLTSYSAAMTNSDFVRLIYKNVLGRSGDTAPPEADVAYWGNRMGKGGVSKGELVRTMLDSAHTFAGDATWGWVPQLLDNKVEVANFIAVQQGINYNTPSESIAKTMAIAAAVTPTGTVIAKSLAGFSDTAFDLTRVGKD